MTFGEKLYALRRQAGFSQEDLAEKLGVTRQAISRWESGAVLPDAPNLLQLGRLFEVSIDYLLRDELTGPAGQPGGSAAPSGIPDAPEGPGTSGPAVAGAADFPAKGPSLRDILRLSLLGVQALGFLLVLTFLYEQNTRAVLLCFVLLNAAGILLFEIVNALLPGTEQARGAARLLFYRSAVWCFSWLPLSMLSRVLCYLILGYSYSSAAPILSTVVLYLFLCGGITYAVWQEKEG